MGVAGRIVVGGSDRHFGRIGSRGRHRAPSPAGKSSPRCATGAREATQRVATQRSGRARRRRAGGPPRTLLARSGGASTAPISTRSRAFAEWARSATRATARSWPRVLAAPPARGIRDAATLRWSPSRDERGPGRRALRERRALGRSHRGRNREGSRAGEDSLLRNGRRGERSSRRRDRR